MEDSRHTRKLLSEISQPSEADGGAKKTFQQTGRAFQLEIRPLAGDPEFFAWALYQGAKHYNRENPERLLMLFHTRAVVVTGYCLQEITSFISLERNELIAEQATSQQKEYMAENANLAWGARKAVILSVKGLPDFDQIFNAITEPPMED